MRRTLYRWFWAWDFDKEEAWLNSMAAKGLALVAVGFCKYIFEECVPGEYQVRLELLENMPTHAESQQYIKFVEETGAEYLGDVIRWVYFRRKTDGGNFNLYSDNASRIRHLNRLLLLLGVIAVLNLGFGLANVVPHPGSVIAVGLGVGLINLSFALLIGCGLLRVYRKKRKLQELQKLFE